MDLTEGSLKPFLCSTMDQALIRFEWEKWIRAFKIYIAAKEITDTERKRNLMLHFGGTELQEVFYNIPGADVEYDKNTKNDVFGIAVQKLEDYFIPKRNSTFERHLFRTMEIKDDENVHKFLVRMRHQASKCDFGETKQEILEINLKDKLIDACKSTELKRKLMEKELTLDEIVNAIKVHEQLSSQTKSMQPSSSGTFVNRVSSDQRSRNKNHKMECGRCGSTNHNSSDPNCPAKELNCTKCNYRGHFAKKCRTVRKRGNNETNGNPSKRFKSTNVRNVESDSDEMESSRSKICFNIVENNKSIMYSEKIECIIGGQSLNMIIDSGCNYNMIAEESWEHLKGSKAEIANVRHSNKLFKSYASTANLQIKLVFDAKIAVSNGNCTMATFYVIKDGTQSLLGKRTAIELDVLRLGVVNAIEERQKLSPFPVIKDIVMDFKINDAVKPCRQPYRRVPIPLESKINAKIDELLQLDIIEPVEGPSAWISPMVPIIKDNGELRLCIDMRRANEAIVRENYPLPTMEDFLPSFVHAKLFSKLDIKNAFHQLILSEDCRHITTFVTKKGLFRYKRLMFGLNVAPEAFQKTFEQILIKCKNCVNFLDDILVFGKDEKEHDECLNEVLAALKAYNVLLNEKKCVLKVKNINFLGLHLSEKGVRPSEDKIVAIKNFRAPKNAEELRSFLGLVTFVGRFIPNLATINAPLRELLKTDVKYEWTDSHEIAFQILKDSISNIKDLGYFKVSDRTRVVADASPWALGSVLIQFDKENVPRVISYASKSLTETEKRYCQTEKEALALVWAVERFFIYLCGLEFELETDHRPLEAIFKPTSKPCARIERWVLRLQSFKYRVIYRSGKSNLADSLSRLSENVDNEPFDEECEQYIRAIIENVSQPACTIQQIEEESSQDEELKELKEAIETDDWTHEKVRDYKVFKEELCISGEIVLRGTKIIIPSKLRQKILQLAHEGHPGEKLMKQRLREKVWWPKIDREAENIVKTCRGCLLVSTPSNPEPMIRKQLPMGPWLDIAMDFLGPLPWGDYFLILVDYYSRYIEIEIMQRITSTETIKRISKIFCRLGYPQTITVDNGRQFVSEEFKSYCNNNNIVLNHTSPYWPQQNGEIERQNRSVLKRLKISYNMKKDWKADLLEYLMMYYTTPHSTTGKTPTELLFGRTIRDKIPSITEKWGFEMNDSEIRDIDLINKEKGKASEDNRRHAKQSEIQVGDRVLMKNVIIQNKLTSMFSNDEYVVTQRKGAEVTVQNQRTDAEYKRNVSHLKKVPQPADLQTEPEPSVDKSTEVFEQPLQPERNTERGDDQDQEHMEQPPLSKLKLVKKGEMWYPA